MKASDTHRAARAGRRRPAARAAALVAALAAAALAAAASAPARAAEGLWDSLLETMNVKAAPPAAGPDFVERSRPDPAELGYLPTATPHKVSPVAVKTPAQIQAEKDALDLARKHQLGLDKPAPAVKAAASKAPAGKPGAPAASPATGKAGRPAPPAAAD